MATHDRAYPAPNRRRQRLTPEFWAVLAMVLFSDDAAAGNCTRLPLSDIAFGREATITQAREKLDDYARRVAAERGWGSTRKSQELVDCAVFLDLGPLGIEYKCLITATFCQK